MPTSPSARARFAQTISVPDLPPEKYSLLDQYIEGLPNRKGALIDIIYKAQEIFGFLPREVLLFIARKLGLSGAEVFGVVSFYSNFTTNPRGLHTISVCMGTACFVKGAEKLVSRLKEKLGIELGETSKDGLFTLKDIRCVGACSLAPVVMIDDKIYGRVTPEELDRILDSYHEHARKSKEARQDEN